MYYYQYCWLRLFILHIIYTSYYLYFISYYLYFTLLPLRLFKLLIVQQRGRREGGEGGEYLFTPTWAPFAKGNNSASLADSWGDVTVPVTCLLSKQQHVCTQSVLKSTILRQELNSRPSEIKTCDEHGTIWATDWDAETRGVGGELTDDVIIRHNMSQMTGLRRIHTAYQLTLGELIPHTNSYRGNSRIHHSIWFWH